MLYFAANFGLVFGTLTVGYILPLGIGYVFALATSIQILFLLVAYKKYNVARSVTENKRNFTAHKGKMTSQILGVLFLTLVCWLVYEQWQSNLSAYMVELGFPVKKYSLLWTLNAVLIVAFQPLVTFFDDWLLKHLRGRLNLGALLLVNSFVILLLPFKHNYWLYLLSMCLLTLGEILLFPGVASFVDLAAPTNLTGYYQGKVQVFSALGKAIGPVFGALIIDNSNYEVLFLVCGLMVLGAELVFSLPLLKKTT